MCGIIPGLLLAATRAANNCCTFRALTPASMKLYISQLKIYHISSYLGNSILQTQMR